MHYPMKKVINIGLLATVCAFFVFLPYSEIAALVPPLDPADIGTTLNLPSEDLQIIVIKIIQWVLGMLGLIVVIMILYGGFMWLTSAGNEEKISKAKKILTAAIIGLAIVVFSYAIFQYVWLQVHTWGGHSLN